MAKPPNPHHQDPESRIKLSVPRLPADRMSASHVPHTTQVPLLRVSRVTVSVTVLVVVALCAGRAQAYPGGAGPQACPQESPEVCHGVKAQTSPSPYSLLVEGTSYSPGLLVNGRCAGHAISLG